MDERGNFAALMTPQRNESLDGYCPRTKARILLQQKDRQACLLACCCLLSHQKPNAKPPVMPVRRRRGGGRRFRQEEKEDFDPYYCGGTYYHDEYDDEEEEDEADDFPLQHHQRYRSSKKMRATLLPRDGCKYNLEGSSSTSAAGGGGGTWQIEDAVDAAHQRQREAHLQLARDFVRRELQQQQQQPSISNSDSNSIWRLLRPFLAGDPHLALAGLEAGVYAVRDLPRQLRSDRMFWLQAVARYSDLFRWSWQPPLLFRHNRKKKKKSGNRQATSQPPRGNSSNRSSKNGVTRSNGSKAAADSPSREEEEDDDDEEEEEDEEHRRCRSLDLSVLPDEFGRDAGFLRCVLLRRPEAWWMLPPHFQGDPNFATHLQVYDHDLAEAVLERFPALRHDRSTWRKIILDSPPFAGDGDGDARGSLFRLLRRYAPGGVRRTAALMVPAAARCRAVRRLWDAALWQRPALERVLREEGAAALADVPPAVLRDAGGGNLVEDALFHGASQDLSAEECADVVDALRAAELWEWDEEEDGADGPDDDDLPMLAVHWFEAGLPFVPDRFPASWTRHAEIAILIAQQRPQDFATAVAPELRDDFKFMFRVVQLQPLLYFGASARLRGDHALGVAALAHWRDAALRRRIASDEGRPERAALRAVAVRAREQLRGLEQYDALVRLTANPRSALSLLLLDKYGNSDNSDHKIGGAHDPKALIAAFLDVPDPGMLHLLHQAAENAAYLFGTSTGEDCDDDDREREREDDDDDDDDDAAIVVDDEDDYNAFAKNMASGLRGNTIHKSNSDADDDTVVPLLGVSVAAAAAAAMPSDETDKDSFGYAFDSNLDITTEDSDMDTTEDVAEYNLTTDEEENYMTEEVLFPPESVDV